MNAEKHVKDSAVSPVVGVMLMLVVTIVIAALVASFAGGLVLLLNLHQCSHSPLT